MLELNGCWISAQPQCSSIARMQFALTAPAGMDRAVQAAMKLAVELILLTSSSREATAIAWTRAARMRWAKWYWHVKASHCWVVDADRQSYFDSIPRLQLLAKVAGRVTDSRLPELVQYFLK